MLIKQISSCSRKNKRKLYLYNYLYHVKLNCVSRFTFYRPKKTSFSRLGRKIIKTRKFYYKFVKLKLFDFKNIYLGIGVNTCIFYNYNKNKFFSLITSGEGVAFLTLTNNLSQLFNYYFFNPSQDHDLTINTILIQFKDTKLNDIVSMISSRNNTKAQYCLSSGTKCKIHFVNHYRKKLRLILPSKEIKIFPLSYYCFKGPVFFKLWKKIRCNKVTKNGKNTFRVSVRGVAKNPVDHPHGGSTKAIKFHRTPWGFSTKKK